MPERSFQFQWWYLLLLLPLLLYLGARWYIGYRIDQVISSANTDGNTLVVGAYDYGLFPLHLRANHLRFDQDRETLSAEGRLTTLELDRLKLFSLIGSDPIELGLIRMQGLEADVRRTGSSKSDSSSFALEVSEIELDSIFLQYVDEVNQQEATLTNFALSLQSFQLPFRANEIESLRVTADSTFYANRKSDLRVVASGLGYGSGSESIAIANLNLRRGSETDVEASRVVVSGVNAQDMAETISIDSLSVEELGGVAQVPTSSGNTADSSGTTPIWIGTLRLPSIDLQMSGDFGKTSYLGGITADDLSYRDSLSVGHLSVDGDSLSFSDGEDLAVHLRDPNLDQQQLRFPLAAGELGATRLELPAFRVTSDGQTVSGTSLSYRSETSEASAEQLAFRGNKVNGSTDRLTVRGVDRTGLLVSRPASLETVLVEGARITVYQQDGGRYQVSAPQVSGYDVQVQKPISTSRVKVENASFSRYGSDGRKDMQGEGIYVDQRDIPVPFEPEALGEGNVRMRELHLIGSKELPVDYYFSRIVYDSRAQLLTMHSLQRQTRIGTSELFNRKLAKTHMNFSFDSLRLAGIRRNGILRGKIIHIDSLAARGFRLRVVEDLDIEVSGNERPMPVEALRNLGIRIVLKKARIRSTDIAYGIVDSVMDAKTIHFTDGVVVLKDVDTEVSLRDSILATIDATFEQTTPLHAEFRLSRRQPGRGYSALGELGTYDLGRVNPLMRVAAGAIIETGVIEKITYDARMHQDTVRGNLTMLYHDLNVKLVDGGLAWFKNLLSGVVVKNGNSRGEDFRRGEIYYEHNPVRSFFNSYWQALVSGMRSTALSDIVLKEELD